MATETATSPFCLQLLSSKQIHKKILFKQDVKKMNNADSTILKRKLTTCFNANEEMKLVACLIKLNTCQPGTVSTQVKPPPPPHLPERKQIYSSQQVLSTHPNALPTPHWRYKIDNLTLSPSSFTSLLSIDYVLSLLSDGCERRFMTRLLSDSWTWWVLEKGSVVLGMTTSHLPSTLWEGVEWFGRPSSSNSSLWSSAWGKI